MEGYLRGQKSPGALLQGKVALVTGGSRGIGKAVARAYAREGAKNEEDLFQAGHETLPIDPSVACLCMFARRQEGLF